MLLHVEKYYPFRVWLLTLIGTPFFFFAWEFLVKNVEYEGREARLVLLGLPVLGLIFSLPVFLIYYLFFYILTRYLSSVFLIKSVLALVAIVGVFAVLVVTRKSSSLAIQQWTDGDTTLLIHYSFWIIFFTVGCLIKQKQNVSPHSTSLSLPNDSH